MHILAFFYIQSKTLHSNLAAYVPPQLDLFFSGADTPYSGNRKTVWKNENKRIHDIF